MFAKLTYHSTTTVVYANFNHIVKLQVNHAQNGTEYLTIYLVDGSHLTVNENSADLATQGERFGLNIFGR